mgnify:CR=1 FL=1|jgi:hypothetical protein
MKEINQKDIITKIKEEVETALYLYDSDIPIWKRSVRRAYYLFMTLTIMCITDNDIFSVEYAKISLQVNFSLLYERQEIASYIKDALIK